MSLLERLFSWNGAGSASSAPQPKAFDTFGMRDDPYLSTLLGDYLTGRGARHVSERSALANSSFFRGANLISSTIGQLPLNLMMKSADGVEAKATDHPVQKLLRVSPNPLRKQTPFEFKSYMQGRALLCGNAFAYIIPGARGPQALIQLDPARMTVRQLDDWSVEYIWQPIKGERRTFKEEELFHLRAPWSSDGILGDGLLQLASESLSRADTLSEIANRMLANGSHGGGQIKSDKPLSAEAARRLKVQFEELAAGPQNSGKWMVMEEGLNAVPFGMTGRDAQGVEQMKLLIEEMARFTGVPRPLLMMDDTSWGSGIEQLGLYFVTYCLLPWFVAWEEAIARSLLTDAERSTHYAKFNDAALLRGSLKDQAEFFAKALGGPGATGYMVPNEAREKMELPPKDGGDAPNWGQASTGGPNAPPPAA